MITKDIIFQARILKQYPAKLRLISLQCFFSCLQSTVLAVAMEANISSWKLGWDVNLFSVAYCVYIFHPSQSFKIFSIIFKFYRTKIDFVALTIQKNNSSLTKKFVTKIIFFCHNYISDTWSLKLRHLKSMCDTKTSGNI